jgi:hypothetical protein
MSLNEDPAIAGQQPTPDIPVDDGWAEQFAGQEEAGEIAPKISGQTIPTFQFYRVKFHPGKGGLSRGAKKTPLARIHGEILDGPEGTVGERVFEDMYLRVSKTTTENGLEVPKSEKDYDEDCGNFQYRLNKIARVGKFESIRPTAPVEEALTAYAQQFDFEAIIEIRESSDTWQGVTRMRNRFIWESLRGIDDPAITKKAKPGTTALQEATEKIEAADKAAAMRAGKDGRTAGSVARRSSGLAE